MKLAPKIALIGVLAVGVVIAIVCYCVWSCRRRARLQSGDDVDVVVVSSRGEILLRSSMKSEAAAPKYLRIKKPMPRGLGSYNKLRHDLQLLHRLSPS